MKERTAEHVAGHRIRCSSCGSVHESVESGICPGCGARVEIVYDLGLEAPKLIAADIGIWRYRALLPVSADLPIITMGEGNTPLVKSCAIGPAIGVQELYFKLETCNPTGSFKDRIASLMVSRYRGQGVETILTITSGNAGSAVAAYAARAGIRCVVLQMAEAPVSKRLQLHAYDAVVILLKGIKESPNHLNRAFSELVAVGKTQEWPVSVMSHFYDPVNVEAYKTISFEICNELGGKGPDYVYVPVGGGGLFSATWKGFKEFHGMQQIARVPKMIPVQPAGAASVAQGFNQGKIDAVRVEPKSEISGAGGPYASDGSLVIASLHETGGHCSCPTDEETYKAQHWLAREEGIFAEPAGALSVAGLIRDVEEKRLHRNNQVVCLITGSGFKDREAAERLFIPPDTPSLRVGELDRIPSIVEDY